MNTALEYLKSVNWEGIRSGQLCTEGQLHALLLTPDFSTSSHLIYIIFDDSHAAPVLIAKLPRRNGDNTAITCEATNLRLLEKRFPNSGHSVPQVVSFGRHGWRMVLVETALPGIPMSPNVVRQHGPWCADGVFQWILKLHRATAEREPNVEACAARQQLLSTSLQDVELILDGSASEYVLLENTRKLADELQSMTLPSVFEHGDLCHPNILIGAHGVGVVDWEVGTPAGLPLADVFVFLAYVAFAKERSQTPHEHAQGLQRAFFGPDAWAGHYIREYSAALKLPASAVYPIFVLTWAKYVGKLVARLRARTDPIGSDIATQIAAVRENRYFQYWRYALEHRNRATLGCANSFTGTGQRKFARLYPPVEEPEQ